MGTFWQDVKSSVKKGVSVAADKTEEYGKIGKVKLDLINVNKQLEKTFRDLGEKAYQNLKSKAKTGLADESGVKEMLVKIDDLKKKVVEKEAEIEKIKKEAEAKKEKKAVEEKKTE